MSKWKEIWNKRDTDHEGRLDANDIEQTVLALKKYDGFDITDEGMTFESFRDQFLEMKNELSWNGRIGRCIDIRSAFEVGCGAGANLYFFEKYQPSLERCGGVDYSEPLIGEAHRILSMADELYVGEALDIDSSKQYTCCFANSVFSYFPDMKYAENVLEKMVSKSEYSIGIIDVHDINKKEEFTEYRRKLIPDYDDRYKDLGKTFYDKSFFMNFADRHGLDVKFVHSDVKGYWNNRFVFNVYMYKRS